MRLIELSNARCRAQVTPEQGGRVTSLEVGGPELLGPHHLQNWVKHGTDHDPASGVLQILFPGLQHKTFDVVATAPDAVELSAEARQLRAVKRFTLETDAPVLVVETAVTNIGDEAMRLQIEHSFNWKFGPGFDSKRVVTALIGAGECRRIDLPPYGDIYCQSFDAGHTVLALCDLDAKQTVLQLPQENCARFTIYQVAGGNWRGPYSPEKLLAPGESFLSRVRVAVVSGCAAIDTVCAGRAVGLMPERRVFLNDEPIKLAVGAANLDEVGKNGSACELRAAHRDAGTFTLKVPKVSYAGASQDVQLAPGAITAGETALAADFGDVISAASIHVYDSVAAAATPLVQASPNPDFIIRAMHLITSQQENRRLTIDALKWLVEHVLAPCGYTHVIWEFNRALKLRSHPELADEIHFDPDGVRDLVHFCRALGVEPIPQQNFFGHQHETNLLNVYPELREDPRNNSVYCPRHPKTRQIVSEMLTEVLELFEPRYFHIGHDEIQFRGLPQSIGICPRCRTQPAADAYAYDVNELDAVIKRHGARTILWGDLLIPPEFDGSNVNGLLGEVYRAVDMIPKDVVIGDWHYYPSEDYRSNEFFIGKGFEVWNVVWFHQANVEQFARHGKRAGVNGMMFTTWCRPDLGSLPVESLLYAAQCFQGIDSASDPALSQRLPLTAHRLWREWQKWNQS